MREHFYWTLLLSPQNHHLSHYTWSLAWNHHAFWACCFHAVFRLQYNGLLSYVGHLCSYALEFSSCNQEGIQKLFFLLDWEVLYCVDIGWFPHDCKLRTCAHVSRLQRYKKSQFVCFACLLTCVFLKLHNYTGIITCFGEQNFVFMLLFCIPSSRLFIF